MLEQPAGEDARRLPTALLVLGLVLFAAAGALAGLIEVTLIPLRHGTALIPVAPVLTVATGVLLPLLGRRLTDSTAGAAPPAFGQLLTIWLLGTGRPEGDVLMPAGSTSWVSYGVLVLGTLVPLAVLGLGSRLQRLGRFSRRRPARHGSDSGGGS